MIFVAVRALPMLTYPLGRDQGSHLFIGRSLLDGKVLYRDLWDNRNPGIYYLHTIIVKVFGSVMWSEAVLDILWLLVISYCMFRFAEHYIGSAGAAIAIAVHASWHVQAGYVWTSQPENFQLLFVFLAYFLVVRHGRWPNPTHFLAGIMLGAGWWFKFNSIAFLPFLLLLPYLDTGGLDKEPRRIGLTLPWRSWFARAVVLLAGFGVTIGLVLGYFWLVGAWPAMKEIQFEVLPRYAAMAFQSRPYYWRWALRSTEYWLGFWTEVATLASLIIAWRFRDLARFTPVFFAAAIAFASTAMQLRFHDYYFQTCFPFFAMMWGYLGVRIYKGCRAWARKCAQRQWRLAAVLVWIIFANVVYWPLPEEIGQLSVEYRLLREWWREGESFYLKYPWLRRIEHLPSQLDAARYLKEHSAPGDGVFIWGAHALIYFLSDRYPPTRFVSNLGLMAVWTPPAWRDELLRDLEKSPPRFIVVASKDHAPNITYHPLDSRDYLKVFPKLNAFITNSYRQVADFDAFTVYEREPLASKEAGVLAKHESRH